MPHVHVPPPANVAINAGPAIRAALHHSLLEDIQATGIGTLLVALAVTLFQHAGLLSGGTAGIAFLGHYLAGWPFGASFFLLNMPFYWLAWRHMGRSFTLRTLAAIACVSLLSDWLPQHLVLGAVDGWLAAVLGGVLMGNGFLVLFRHRASLGGLGIVALLAQQRLGWRAGHVQLAFDALIVGAAALAVPPLQVLQSIAAVVVLNLVIATNHRAERYVAH